MTTIEELLAFLELAEATLHVMPSGVIILTTVDKDRRVILTNTTAGDMAGAVSAHSHKVFA